MRSAGSYSPTPSCWIGPHAPSSFSLSCPPPPPRVGLGCTPPPLRRVRLGLHLSSSASSCWVGSYPSSSASSCWVWAAPLLHPLVLGCVAPLLRLVALGWAAPSCWAALALVVRRVFIDFCPARRWVVGVFDRVYAVYRGHR